MHAYTVASVYKTCIMWKSWCIGNHVSLCTCYDNQFKIIQRFKNANHAKNN